MRVILAMLAGLILVAGVARAQTLDDLVLSVGAYELVPNGAEKPVGVWHHITLSTNKTTVGLFSVSGCGAFTLTVPPNRFAENAIVGWRVEVTPTRVEGKAVTFRLRWIRTPGINADVTPMTEDTTVTLLPGESRPIDTVPINLPSGRTVNGGACQTKTSSLRATVEYLDLDRRLVGAEVWLVEHLPNGKEQSQLQSVRGLPYRALPFYFDSVTQGTNRLDIFGQLTPDLEGGGLKLDVQATTAGPAPDQVGYQSANFFRSTLHLKPGEIVEVALPRPKDSSDPFVDRVLSIRIRAKQIR
ncbi:MAG: hypothetical protein ABI634_05310 [Acidobacteriota bacterium]